MTEPDSKLTRKYSALETQLCVYLLKKIAYSGTVFIPQIHIMTSHPVSVFPPFLPPKHSIKLLLGASSPRTIINLEPSSYHESYHESYLYILSISYLYPIYILSIYSSPSSMIATTVFFDQTTDRLRHQGQLFRRPTPRPRLDFSPGYSAGRCLRCRWRSRPGALLNGALYGTGRMVGGWKDVKRESWNCSGTIWYLFIIYIYTFICVCGCICIIYSYNIYIYIWYISIFGKYLTIRIILYIKLV